LQLKNGYYFPAMVLNFTWKTYMKVIAMTQHQKFSPEVQKLVAELAVNLREMFLNADSVAMNWECDNDNKKLPALMAIELTAPELEAVSNSAKEVQIKFQEAVRSNLQGNVQQIMKNIEEASKLPMRFFLANLEAVEFTIGKLFPGSVASASQTLVQKLIVDIYDAVEPKKPAAPKSFAPTAASAPAPGRQA
jgi:hypothetical protein